MTFKDTVVTMVTNYCLKIDFLVVFTEKNI